MPVTISGTSGITTPGISSSAASSFSSTSSFSGASSFSADVTLAGAGVQVLNNSGRIVLNQAGSVIQVVSTTKTDTFTSASATFIDITGMSVSITPTSTSSQILVFLVSNCSVSIGSAPQVFNLVRNSTAICQPSTSPTYFGTVTPYNQNADNSWGWSMLFLDSPATTSATTYKLQGRTGAGTFAVNRRSSADFASTSTITVMEIAA